MDCSAAPKPSISCATVGLEVDVAPIAGLGKGGMSTLAAGTGAGADATGA